MSVLGMMWQLHHIDERCTLGLAGCAAKAESFGCHPAPQHILLAAINCRSNCAAHGGGHVEADDGP